MGYSPDTPVARDNEVFTSLLDLEDKNAMRSYEASIKTETLKMTGQQVRDRLSRIANEHRRIAQLQEHLDRLQRITKATILETAKDGES